MAPQAEASSHGTAISGTTAPENLYLVDGLCTGGWVRQNATPLSIDFVGELSMKMRTPPQSAKGRLRRDRASSSQRILRPLLVALMLAAGCGDRGSTGPWSTAGGQTGGGGRGPVAAGAGISTGGQVGMGTSGLGPGASNLGGAWGPVSTGGGYGGMGLGGGGLGGQGGMVSGAGANPGGGTQGGFGGGAAGSPSLGMPITATPMQWEYVHFPGAICRDGKQTGLGVNLNPTSDKLLLFLKGGGACYNVPTCARNPRSWGRNDVARIPIQRADTFYRDWNLVYVPYCSGDVFSGAATDGSGWNGETQQGFVNLTEYLRRIVPTFRSVTQVVLAGTSAGGFGVAWNWMRVQDAFGPIPVDVLDDSGPPFAHPYMTTCMQQRFGALWKWEATVHADCTDCNVAAGNVVVPLTQAALTRSPTRRFALLSTDEDRVIKAFFSFGLDNCKHFDSVLEPPVYPSGQYPSGLTDLRQRYMGFPNFAVYQVRGNGHVFLLSNDVANVNSAGVNLAGWLDAFVSGRQPWAHVVP